MNRGLKLIVLPLVQVTLLVACGTERAERVLAPSAESAANLQPADDERPRFSDWSAPVNLGPDVNSPSEDMNPGISKDGLSLYFASPRPDVGMVGPDLWVSRRASMDAPWGPPQNLGSTVNMPAPVADNGAALSIDGHRLFFHSNRPGGFGGSDLYVSRRRDNRDDLGWEAPVNLGNAINSSAGESGPAYFEGQDGTVTLYFTSSRPGGLGGQDIYASTALPDGSFGPPVLVRELSSPFDDQKVTVRRDGLEIFLASSRPGSLGGMDIWVATRASTSHPWSTPMNLGPGVNTVHFEAGPAISFDATTLYFHAGSRPENVGDERRFDIWMTTRTRLTGPPEN